MKPLAIAALLALTACKTSVTSDLFTSDLVAATEGETVTAPIVIGLELPGDCAEEGPKMLSAIRRKMTDAEFIGCERVNYDTYARFRAQAEILLIGKNDAAALPNTAFAIGVAREGATFTIKYLRNPDATRAIWDALPEDMTKYKKYELNPVLSAVLNNDLRSTVRITTDDVFADGKPIQGTHSRDLPRRDQVEIAASNVTNSAFGSTDTHATIVVFTVQE